MIGNIVDFDRKESFVFWDDGQNKVPTTPSTLSPSSLHGVGSPLLSENKINGSNSQYCKTLVMEDVKRSQDDILSEDIGCLTENSIGILGWSRNLIQEAVQQESEDSSLFVYPYHSNNHDDMFREEKLGGGMMIETSVSDPKMRQVGELASIRDSRVRCSVGGNTHCVGGLTVNSDASADAHDENLNSISLCDGSIGDYVNSGSDIMLNRGGACDGDTHIDTSTLNMLYSRIQGYNSSSNRDRGGCGYSKIDSNTEIGGSSANMDFDGGSAEYRNMTDSIFKEMCTREESQGTSPKDISRYMDNNYLEILKTNLIMEFTKSRTCYLKLVPSVIEIFRIVRDVPSRCPVPIVQSIDDLGKEKNIERFENYFNNCIAKQNCGFLAFCTEKRALKSGGGGKYYFFDRKLQLNGCHKVDVLNHHRQKNILGPVFMKVLLFMFVVDPPYHLDPRARSSNPQRLMDFYYQLKSMNKLGSIKRLLKVWCMEMCPDVYLDAGYPSGSLLWVSTLDIESHIKKWRYRGKKCLEKSVNMTSLLEKASRKARSCVTNHSGEEGKEGGPEKRLLLETGVCPVSNREVENGYLYKKSQEHIAEKCKIQGSMSKDQRIQGMGGGDESKLQLNGSVCNIGVSITSKLSHDQVPEEKLVMIGGSVIPVGDSDRKMLNSLTNHGSTVEQGGRKKVGVGIRMEERNKFVEKGNLLLSTNNNFVTQKKSRGRGRPPRAKQKESERRASCVNYEYLEKGHSETQNDKSFRNSELNVFTEGSDSVKTVKECSLSGEESTVELEFKKHSDLEYSSLRFIWELISSLTTETLDKFYVSWLNGSIPGVTRLLSDSSSTLQSYLNKLSCENKRLNVKENNFRLVGRSSRECYETSHRASSPRIKTEYEMDFYLKKEGSPQSGEKVGDLSPGTVLYHKAFYLVIRKHLLVHSGEQQALLRALKGNRSRDEKERTHFSSEMKKVTNTCEKPRSQMKSVEYKNPSAKYQNETNVSSSLSYGSGSINKDLEMRSNPLETLNCSSSSLSSKLLSGVAEERTQSRVKKKENERREKVEFRNSRNKGIQLPNTKTKSGVFLYEQNREAYVYGESNAVVSVDDGDEREQGNKVVEFEVGTREQGVRDDNQPRMYSIISSSQYQDYAEIPDMSSSISEQLLCDQGELSKHCSGGNISEPIDLFFAIT